MEKQDKLVSYDKNLEFDNFKSLIKLKPNPKSLENEKRKFKDFMANFIDKIDFENNQCNGRPRFYLKDIIKSLLIMSYNGMSYRRAESDLISLKEQGIIKHIPKRSTLCKYMLLDKTKKILEKLITLSSLFFIEHENVLICDSTWLATKMYVGGHKNVYNKKSGAPLSKVRKLHISCLRNSKVIACARATKGTINDSPIFQELVHIPIKNGFIIKKLIADAGYSGKDNYAFCQALNIKEIFIDFKKNASLKRAKSSAWRTQLKLFKENPEQWHESYRFRVLVEGIFSTIKRKHLNYLRSRKENSQDVELLLKCLVYNFTIVGKYFMDNS